MKWFRFQNLSTQQSVDVSVRGEKNLKISFQETGLANTNSMSSLIPLALVVLVVVYIWRFLSDRRVSSGQRLNSVSKASAVGGNGKPAPLRPEWVPNPDAFSSLDEVQVNGH